MNSTLLLHPLPETKVQATWPGDTAQRSTHGESRRKSEGFFSHTDDLKTLSEVKNEIDELNINGKLRSHRLL